MQGVNRSSLGLPEDPHQGVLGEFCRWRDRERPQQSIQVFISWGNFCAHCYRISFRVDFRCCRARKIQVLTALSLVFMMDAIFPVTQLLLLKSKMALR